MTQEIDFDDSTDPQTAEVDPRSPFRIDVPDEIENAHNLAFVAREYWADKGRVPDWFNEVNLYADSVDGDTATIDPKSSGSPTDADYEAAREWAQEEFEEWLNTEYEG